MYDKLKLSEIYGLRLITGVSGKNHTSYRGGGDVPFAVMPETVAELRSFRNFIRETTCPFAVLGGGTNTLIPDCGYNGATVITNKFRGIEVNDVFITSGSHESVARIARIAEENGLSGMESLSGIPGSIGGAAVMNAGSYGRELCELVDEVGFFDFEDGKIYKLPGSKIPWAYRSSGDLFNNRVIVTVKLRLFPGESDSIHSRTEFVKNLRRDSQPAYPSLGSVFKKINGIGAGFYIDKAGLKGISRGGAEISRKHAGFIVNKGGGTASDFLYLKNLAEEAVFRKFGVRPETEIKILT